MAEYIEREAALSGYQTVCNGVECSICPIRDNGSCKFEKYLYSIPAADVRPVVLCRECKHRGWVQEPEHGKSVDYCRLIERCVDKQFFCAAGEKREES